ncbi:regulatory protein, LysR [Fulvimarina pelagi HTCC2506]|uniref:Regulatory protein, LysR n=1 Tax=Fulvimarina pelagi HTCC2506 TaxID=314231 RepID=Q0G396_9HYPH|nr:hydrogen peroxide-inducible genes activator [Fulvimarina pelagi]EAU41935.1 regulatory protein, LysR [Fulvimarina pelagi HTCC2506]
MLTLRQIRYFETLARTLHFGRAAAALNISQPALSGQIHQMEAFFDTPLFHRKSNGVSLTADGELVEKRVLRILADVRELEGLAAIGDGVLSGHLRVGMIATVAPYILPRLLPLLSGRFPKLECEVRESMTERLIADVKRGDIDCAVVALPLGDEDLQTLQLFDDPFFLAAPPEIAVRLPNPVPATIVNRERIILLEEGHCLRSQALDVCRLAGGPELGTLGATSLTTILRMVAGGLGATLIPKIAIADETRGGGFEVLPFQDPVPYRRLALAFRPTTARFRDFEALGRVLREAADGPPETDGET